MQSLSIVIPVYNEEDNIGPLVSRIAEAMSGWDGNVEILFVDDGSKDRTVEIVRTYSNVRLIIHAQTRGYAGDLKPVFANATGSLLS